MSTLRTRVASWGPVTWLLVLWGAFALVHGITIFSGWHMANQPMGDVPNVYRPWSAAALGGEIVGVTEPWVYPPLALVPMVATRLFDFLGNYTIEWGVFITLWNALGFAYLMGRCTSLTRRWAAAFWLAYILLMGPVGLYRIDAVTVPLAIVAVMVIGRHPAVASVLLTVGAWIKIWPAAVLLGAFAVMRRRLALVWPAALVSALVCVCVIAMGGAQNLFGFLSEQSDRGLQVEAPISLIYVWGAMFGIRGTGIHYNREIITFQVDGPGADILSAAMTPLLLITAVTISIIGWLRTRAGVSPRRVLPPLVLALVASFIVMNKVGSPQFQCWLIAPLVLWILWDRRTARPYVLAALVSAALTQVVYPIIYNDVLVAAPVAVLVLTGRNLIVVGLLVASMRRLLGLGARVHDEDDAIAIDPHRTITVRRRPRSAMSVLSADSRHEEQGVLE